MDYSCFSCDRYFGSKEALEQHQRDSPIHKQTFHCKTCNCLFGSGKALKTHRRYCQVYQEFPEGHPDASLNPQRNEAALSNIWAGYSIPDLQAMLLQHHIQIPALDYPVTTTAHPKVAKGNVPEPAHETRIAFMFPALHESIAEAVFPEITSTWFNEDENDDDSNDEWPTHVMGRFTCTNQACKSRGWNSRKVSIEIRGYDDNGYNVVVWNQRCKSCDRLGTFGLNEQSYIDRVSYRLKKWAGVRMTPPEYKERTGSPHKTAFCEGCRRGKCSEGDRFGFD